MKALLVGSAGAKDIIALTLFFEREIGRIFTPPRDSLDDEFQEHLVFVFNRILFEVRKDGVSVPALEKIGKLVFRLYRVMQAYREKKKRYTLPEWLERLATLGKELNDVTG